MKNLLTNWSHNQLDLELFFCTEVLKLKSLHYGYWNLHEELTLDNLRNAQQRYTDTLLQFIPCTVSSVLDVGCGIGDISKSLISAGFTADALSPDKNHTRFFKGCDPKLSFYNQRFEEFNSGKQYDLILMSESQNYFDPEQGFLQCKKHLKPGGYLLVSGMFRKKDSQAYAAITNIEQEYLRQAAEHRFRVQRQVDITRQVIPTLRFADKALREHANDVPGLLDRHFSSSPWLKSAFIKLVFKKQIKDVQKVIPYYQERVDPVRFEENVRYLRLLFQYS